MTRPHTQTGHCTINSVRC